MESMVEQMQRLNKCPMCRSDDRKIRNEIQHVTREESTVMLCSSSWHDIVEPNELLLALLGEFVEACESIGLSYYENRASAWLELFDIHPDDPQLEVWKKEQKNLNYYDLWVQNGCGW